MKSKGLAAGMIWGASALVAAGVLAFGTAAVVCPPVRAKSPYAAWEQARHPRTRPGTDPDVRTMVANVSKRLNPEIAHPKADPRAGAVVTAMMTAPGSSKSAACVNAPGGGQVVLRPGDSFLGFRVSAVDSGRVTFDDGFTLQRSEGR